MAGTCTAQDRYVPGAFSSQRDKCDCQILFSLGINQKIPDIRVWRCSSLRHQVFEPGKGQKASHKVIVRPAPVGTIGSFLFNVKHSMSLASSPLVTKTEGQVGHKAFESAYGFDEQRDAFCASLAETRGKWCDHLREHH